jgi:hypothetical protein
MPPAFTALSLHCKITRWIVLQKARRHGDKTNLRFFLSRRAKNVIFARAIFSLLEKYKEKVDLPNPRSDSLYAHNFRFYFTPLSGVLLTFPSRYLFTIDRKTYLALEGGPSGFSQGFTCPDLLEI